MGRLFGNFIDSLSISLLPILHSLSIPTSLPTTYLSPYYLTLPTTLPFPPSPLPPPHLMPPYTHPFPLLPSLLFCWWTFCDCDFSAHSPSLPTLPSPTMAGRHGWVFLLRVRWGLYVGERRRRTLISIYPYLYLSLPSLTFLPFLQHFNI